MTKILLAATAAALALSGSPAQAREYPWCAHYGGGQADATNCGFDTIEQCRATISGIGGICERNGFYVEPKPVPRRKKR